jgi:hypothetical protein
MPLSTRFRAQPLCLVQRVVRVFEHVGAAAGKLGVSHRDPRAQGDGAVGAALVWNPQAFDAESHAFDSDERVRQGLFGENAQELFTAVSIQIVDATRLLLPPRADGLKDVVTGLVAVTVVVGLEMVDVRERHAIPRPIPVRSQVEQFEVFLENPAVPEPGERILAGEDRELAVEPV